MARLIAAEERCSGPASAILNHLSLGSGMWQLKQQHGLLESDIKVKKYYHLFNIGKFSDIFSLIVTPS